MAVDYSKRTIRDFRRIYKRNSLFLLSASLTFLSFLISSVMAYVYKVDPLSFTFWMMSLSVLLPTLFFAIITYSVLSRPLFDLLAAIEHKIGSPTISSPPNPNADTFIKTGLKQALEFIYADRSEAGQSSSSHKDRLKSLSSSLDQVSTGVVLLDANRQIISANKATPVATGQDGADFLALNFVDDEDIVSWASSCESKTINAEKRWRRVGTDQRYIDKQRFFDIYATYNKGADAEVVVFLFDHSDQYLPEEEDLNFIAFAAHELRGPITVIRGYLDVLEGELEGRLTNDEPDLFNRLSVSANRLSSYINNILNVARYDRHHLQVHLYEDSIADIYETIADDMQLRARTMARLLNVNIPKNLPKIAADRGSIGEVLGNLVDNAIKYSFEGGVVTVSAKAKGDFVEVTVKDNGIGMPANVVSNLFRKFYRSHRSRETVAGSGIGLYICKAYVESHGGSISVSSRENEGSVFSFTIPTYASVADKLLEDGQLNQSLVRKGGGWINNHSMYRR